MNGDCASSTNIISVLEQHARDKPAQVAFTFSVRGQVADSRSYDELLRRARRVAAKVREVAIPGDRAVLLYPPGLEFIDAFLGCLYAGVVAVPLSVGLSKHEGEKLRALITDAAPACILAPKEIEAKHGANLRSSAPWLTADSTSGPELEVATPSDPAFLQYTSGSTSAPRGVVLTHHNLVANQRCIEVAFEHDASAVVGGWLPLYHDMGLIGNVMQTLWLGVSCHLMSQYEFLREPYRWLELISQHRITTSGAPNFAYDACVRRVPPQRREGVDLSSWSLAFNGAEPVSARTMNDFARAYASSGFRASAFYPCYGLAESTLFVTGVRRGELRTLELDRTALELERRGRPPSTIGAGRELVGCGCPRLDTRVEIVNPDTGEAVENGQVGEICVSGPSVSSGYWRHGDTRAFDVGASGEHRLRTGDLGLVDQGQVFVTGRLRDMIIVAGRNHYAEDIEATVRGSSALLAGEVSAAFAVEGSGEEELVVAQELPRQLVEAAASDDLLQRVREAVALRHGLRVKDLVKVLSGSLSRTSSGKVQRFRVRQAYLNGSLQSRAAGPHSAQLAEGAAEGRQG